MQARAPHRLFTIPSGYAFVDALAAGLWAEAEADPLALSRATVLVPTRRAARALREAFLRLGDGQPMLLPTIRALGDGDDDDPSLLTLTGQAALPPPIGPLQRQFRLAQLIVKMGRPGHAETDGPMAFDQALRLAEALADLLDQIHTEGLSFDGFVDLVPDELADHWQITLQFLQIVTHHWPEILAETGAIDAAAWRNAMMTQQAEAWRQQPPREPVIIAGSTGSVPATVRLMAAVLALPAGAVVLPGLDVTMDDQVWTAISADPSHPFHGMSRLLEQLKLSREAVQPWPHLGLVTPPLASRRARIELLTEALRPAVVTEGWRRLAETKPQIAGPVMDHLMRIDCPDERNEALVVALHLREALETPGRRAALITADRKLARRVKSELRRWDIDIDDSAGEPLAASVPGSFLRLVAEMVTTDLAPVDLLAALKHPLAAGGHTPARFRQLVRQMERQILRGPRPATGIAGLSRVADEDGPVAAINAVLAAPVLAFQAVLADPSARLSDAVNAHVALAEALAASDQETGAARLWRADAGEASARLIAEMLDVSATLSALPATQYVEIFSQLMAMRAVRPRFDRHPRLAILGPLEARLQSYDLMVIGGLNEGSMPPDIGGDPWMSRPMRRAFGLPPPERRIGLSAHDFINAAAAPEVVLTRAQRVEGAPSEPSRWLLRLDAVITALQLPSPQQASAVWIAWAQGLDHPQTEQRVAPPAPTPPLAARPSRYSVTEIETLLRDPYAIYARRILNLKRLEPLDADPGAADRGTIIHHVLDQFVSKYPHEIPLDGYQQLLEMGRLAFANLPDNPGVWAFWWPRFMRIAAWFIGVEKNRRQALERIWSEVGGSMHIETGGRRIELRTKIDRIERRLDGGLAIIDYKTGHVPSSADVARGWSPQLPLEALILMAGGVAEVPADEIVGLEYWRLSGLSPAGEVRPLKDVTALIFDATEGLQALLTTFEQPETPFMALPNPAAEPRFGDYRHLARVKEWGSER